VLLDRRGIDAIGDIAVVVEDELFFGQMVHVKDPRSRG
jgi:hypothetical protein